MKTALSKINRQRNYAIRKAEEMIKERAPGKEVKADQKQRIVTLGGSTVFEQTSGELGGTFRGTVSSLRLPWGVVGGRPSKVKSLSHGPPG